MLLDRRVLHLLSRGNAGTWTSTRLQLRNASPGPRAPLHTTAPAQSLWYLSRIPEARDRQGLARPPPYVEVQEGVGVRTNFPHRRYSGPIAGWDSKRDTGLQPDATVCVRAACSP